ncbi:hypothetical protein QBC34DRAFT_413306 [Podospora aff. communis PSN243]|uniref:Secreted protein n=1 Tax=Podospora aff. communis PSN243 TaxID=3040156 RepID=A0AAV9GD54_9PEZI|nr:hypothetical protein QBC34DRAFT_413306 [Podospora aff. communis PSN243]
MSRTTWRGFFVVLRLKPLNAYVLEILSAPMDSMLDKRIQFILVLSHMFQVGTEHGQYPCVSPFQAVRLGPGRRWQDFMLCGN